MNGLGEFSVGSLTSKEDLIISAFGVIYLSSNELMKALISCAYVRAEQSVLHIKSKTLRE